MQRRSLLILVILFMFLITMKGIKVNASRELAEYEQHKGQANLVLEPEWVMGVDYTYDEYIMLAQIIQAEAGNDYLSDELRYYVGSVVLNRVKSDKFKQNTIESVLTAPGQYYPVMAGTWKKTPDTKCLEIAADLLETGSELPDYVLYQSNFPQGKGTYLYIEGMYFCY